MRNLGQLLNKWSRGKESTAVDSASILPESNPPSTSGVNVPVVPQESTSAADSVTQNISLVLVLAEQVANIAQVAPFIAPAAALLTEILKSYKEVKSINEKRDVLAAHVANLTGGICATVLRMEATNYSELIGRLKLDLKKYAELIARASQFVNEYDSQGKLVRWAARSDLGGEIDKLNQELYSFGARFRTNRLVDITINQSANTETLNKVHDMVVQDKLEKWIQCPDMKQKQHETEKIRKEGTGLWFIESETFIEWQDKPGSLWVEGPSGAGKSVLSSTVIRQLFADEKLFEDGASPPAVAFFYFDFRNEERQSVEIALRRIVLQLSAQSPHPHRVLDGEYRSSNGQKLPSHEDLHKILRQLLRELGRTYIVLDALDECDDFNQLVNLISTLREWTETPLHLFITSQPRQIFTEGFRGIPCIALKFNVTQEDIKFFVASEIQTNPKLKIWRRKAENITDRVVRKSNGMFRLAACLLIELSRCKWEDQLDNKLNNLPDTLFNIYDRFLDAIRPEDLVYVEGILRWIMFSVMPMSLDELADAIAFDFSDAAQWTYKPSRRGDAASAIFDWLDGLIVNSTVNGNPKVALAHASVQDYLLSGHFITRYRRDLNQSLSHTFIARTCISYLLYFADRPPEDGSHRNYPLMVYAAKFWYPHMVCCHDRTVLIGASIRFLESQQYVALTRLGAYAGKSPLHFCCQAGYIEGVRVLLTNHSDEDLGIVRLLLESGADPNRHGESPPGSALANAAYRGSAEMVRLLLQHGADINLPLDCKSGRGSALHAASYNGHVEIVRLLLEGGADANLQFNSGGVSTLVAASSQGQSEIVHLLLEHGADVSTQGSRALNFAVQRGHSRIVALLKEKGAT
ncbi:hypothetical protein K438DRAFT_1837602 [Mycena galopus ATCC 62051]|nr:hypothetical protein K438DRAFT_1837602 [Mycena galopus ATCC 62051]